MTADFLFKGIFAIGVGSMAIVFLRDFLKAANASDSTIYAAPEGVDGVFPFVAHEEVFFDEQGSWRASQRNDDLISLLVDGGFENDVQPNGCDITRH
jgi:hypothetical protein